MVPVGERCYPASLALPSSRVQHALHCAALERLGAHALGLPGHPRGPLLARHAARLPLSGLNRCSGAAAAAARKSGPPTRHCGNTGCPLQRTLAATRRRRNTACPKHHVAVASGHTRICYGQEGFGLLNCL